jgi:hypothetical protein
MNLCFGLELCPTHRTSRLGWGCLPDPANATVLPELVAAAAEVAEARLALGVMMVAVVDAAMIPHYFYREARNGMAVAAAASASAMMSVPAALT